MPSLTRHILASTALTLLAPAAFADLSADDVWNDWKTYISSFGYEVTGQENRAGNVFSVTGVTMTTGPDAAGGAATIAMDQIVMTEQSDGTVTIDLPTVMPFEMATPSETGGTTRISMDYRHTDLAIVASGTPENMRYDYEADSVTLESTGFEVDGQILPPESNVIEIVFEDMTGDTEMTLDAQRRYTQALQVGNVRYAFKVSAPEADATSDITGQTSDITFSGDSVIPLRAIDPGDIDAMLAAGFTADGTFTFAANAMTLALSGEDGAVDASVLAGDGDLDMVMGPDGMTYEVTQNDLEVEITSAQFPVPINFDVAKSAFNMAMPLRKSDTPDDFALGFNLEGFSVSDAIWGLFDPTSQIPRDPATIALDLVGKGRLLFDFLDPSAADVSNDPDITPAEIDALDIQRVQITAAGAELTGQGAFEFDNSADGAPQPQGSVDLKLTGGNGLIDKLVATGLLPEEQAMGARMMMGLLAVPGAEPDTLNSKIEINAEGHVLANGQRIQ
ncbi:DUF2125 domain-containing protein [Roseobacter weihaiensis]|uniref:DUF2125 domain-containing protein n=1 Tax=Roseobacter weihaiensis TaxID=2763262 RepID=UPI001D0B0781|nr:DUF2125 domain-containing protein [Roseobacter sp. H9]